MNRQSENIDSHELDKFASLADAWWDPRGKLRTLHHINPARLRYVDQRVGLKGKELLDLGCGGGVLSEAMARAGAVVTGIDANENAVTTAINHGKEQGLKINYFARTAEDFAEDHSRAFDVITCMELLEHVPDVASLIACCTLMLRPGGHLILSTINRNPKSYAAAVLAAEYLLRLLPRGTHDYSRFIRPSELACWLRSAGFELVDIAGMSYVPGLGTAFINHQPAVNYLAHAVLSR